MNRLAPGRRREESSLRDAESSNRGGSSVGFQSAETERACTRTDWGCALAAFFLPIRRRGACRLHAARDGPAFAQRRPQERSARDTGQCVVVVECSAACDARNDPSLLSESRISVDEKGDERRCTGTRCLVTKAAAVGDLADAALRVESEVTAMLAQTDSSLGLGTTGTACHLCTTLG
jgi:hypothetical protein